MSISRDYPLSHKVLTSLQTIPYSSGSKRLTISEILQHPWIRQPSSLTLSGPMMSPNRLEGMGSMSPSQSSEHVAEAFAGSSGGSNQNGEEPGRGGWHGETSSPSDVCSFLLHSKTCISSPHSTAYILCLSLGT